MHLGTVPGKYVLLRVSDDGFGMDKDSIQHIFEPFYTTKGPGKGTGLGLAMVYGIVKSHRGEINCYSEPEKGTIFRIYFPVVEQESSFQQEPLDNGKIAGGTEIILLVDDEIAIRNLARLMLAECGYTVLTADSGESALETYRSKKDMVSLVILDLNMPGMGGQKCLEEILKIDPAEKVVIASGYGVDSTTEQGLAPGAQGYVSKPYELRTLLKVVREILDQR
jgi:CheY-like chemotaxis protein